MSKTGKAITDGAREAAAISRGELKAARVFSPADIAIIKAKRELSAAKSAAAKNDAEKCNIDPPISHCNTIAIA